MPKKIADTELIFRDLKDIATEIQNEHASPLRIRRLFSQYVTLSQKLTEIMRKEFSDICGTNWEPKSFQGWNAVTSLFKLLRKTDYHSYPVTISVEETQYFKEGDIFDDAVGSNTVAICGTWDLGDPFSEQVPVGLKLMLADQKTGKSRNISVEPIRRQYVFKLKARSTDLDKAIKKTRINDIHQLVEKCFATLSDYYDYYNRCLEK
ncbi:MAG: hypothetical protein AB1306_00935 [Nitrospirota bacterium]